MRARLSYGLAGDRLRLAKVEVGGVMGVILKSRVGRRDRMEGGDDPEDVDLMGDMGMWNEGTSGVEYERDMRERFGEATLYGYVESAALSSKAR